MGLAIGIGIGMPFGGYRGGGSPGYPTEGLPQVIGSTILVVGANEIIVLWDRPMMESCDVKAQIKVIIDSSLEVMPVNIVFSNNFTTMAMEMPEAFVPGVGVTWEYDPLGSCDLHQDAAPQTEAGSAVHHVINQVAISHLWVDENGVPWVDELGDDWWK